MGVARPADKRRLCWLRWAVRADIGKAVKKTVWKKAVGCGWERGGFAAKKIARRNTTLQKNQAGRHRLG